ncbi:MAG: OmpA family protein [Adlercreutzia sp.]|nr:OmpA family protein [Adlercreutzia sp.]
MRRGLAAVMCSLLMAATCLLAGCGSGNSAPAGGVTAEEVRPYDLAIVYSARANSAGDLSLAENYIRAAVEGSYQGNEGFLAGISTDGSPQAFSGTLCLTEQNQRRRQDEVQQNIANILNAGWTAQTSESNIFDAFRRGNEQLGSQQATESQRPNLLLVFDSGISTNGPINFSEEVTRNGLLDPEAFIQLLRESGDLAKFDNVDKVIWYGLGETADPQESPNDGTKAAMENFYRSLFEAAGVEDVEFRPGSGRIATGEYPEVSVVNMPRIPLDEEGNPILLGDTLELDESSAEFQFEYDESNFTDEEAALEGMQEYINQLIDFPSLQVTIKGYTDTQGNEDYNLSLSQRRADTVKRLFVESGVSESQITAVGMGESSDYEDDKQNRRVEIVFGE